MSSQAGSSSLRLFDKLADRLRLHRQADSRPIIVVEGESDRRLLQGVLGRDTAPVFVGGCRSDVLSVAAAMVDMGVDRVVCLVDRDFDDTVQAGIDAGLPLVAYDGADLEDMLMGSPAAPRAIEELASDAKLMRYGVDSLLERVRDQAQPLGRLRRANAQNSWGLVFDSIDLRSKVDKSTLELDVLALCMALTATTADRVSADELKVVASEGSSVACPRTGRRLLRGRDQLAFVGVALRKLVGTRPREQIDPEFLGAVLRAAANPDWLRASQWYRRIIALARLTA